MPHAHPSDLAWFHHQNNILCRVQILKFLVMHFSPFACYWILVQFTIIKSTVQMICTLFGQSTLTVNTQTEVTSLYKDRQMLTSCGFWITRTVNDMRYLLQRRSFRPVLLKYIANLHNRMVQLKSHVPHFGWEILVDTTCITNEWYMLSPVSLQIHFGWQKKCRSTKEKMGRGQHPCKWKKPKNGLHPVADEDPSLVLHLPPHMVPLWRWQHKPEAQMCMLTAHTASNSYWKTICVFV